MEGRLIWNWAIVLVVGITINTLVMMIGGVDLGLVPEIEEILEIIEIIGHAPEIDTIETTLTIIGTTETIEDHTTIVAEVPRPSEILETLTEVKVAITEITIIIMLLLMTNTKSKMCSMKEKKKAKRPKAFGADILDKAGSALGIDDEEDSSKNAGKGGAIVLAGGKKTVPEGCKVVEKGKKEKRIATKADGSKITLKQKVKEQRTTNRQTGTHIETKNVIQEKKKLTSETAEIYELSDGRVAELSGDDRETIVRGVDLKRRLALVRSPRPTGLHHRFRPAASRPHL